MVYLKKTIVIYLCLDCPNDPPDLILLTSTAGPEEYFVEGIRDVFGSNIKISGGAVANNLAGRDGFVFNQVFLSENSSFS